VASGTKIPKLRQGDPMSVLAWARRLARVLVGWEPPGADPPGGTPPPDEPDRCHKHEVLLTYGQTPFNIPEEYSCMDLTVRAEPFPDNGVIRLPVAKPGRWIGLTVVGQVGPVEAPKSYKVQTRSGDDIMMIGAPSAARGYAAAYFWCYGYPVRWTWTTPRTWALSSTAGDET
jgi:hypothetical protein